MIGGGREWTSAWGSRMGERVRGDNWKAGERGMAASAATVHEQQCMLSRRKPGRTGNPVFWPGITFRPPASSGDSALWGIRVVRKKIGRERDSPSK